MTQESDIDYQALSYITNSRYRTDVVLELEDGMSTPARITEEKGYENMSNASRALLELEEKGLVELMVDEDTKKGRFYDLTEAGLMLVDPVREVADR